MTENCGCKKDGKIKCGNNGDCGYQKHEVGKDPKSNPGIGNLPPKKKRKRAETLIGRDVTLDPDFYG